MTIGGVEIEEGKFSHEEQMRRERLRLMATGVTSYEVSKAVDADSDGNDGANNKRVGLIPHGGGLYIWSISDEADAASCKPTLLVDSSSVDGATILDAKISADGSTVAFVADQEVYVMPVVEEKGSKPVQVTSGARGVEGRTNGVADYLAMEELSRPEGTFVFVGVYT